MFKVDLTESDIEALKEALKEMKNTITIKLFTSNDRIGCFACGETEKLVRTIRDSSPLVGNEKAIELEIYEVSRDRDAFKMYEIDRVPTIILLDDAIAYIGMPAGEEIKGFIETIIRLSTNDHGLSPKTVEEIVQLRGRVSIEVVVTPLCPYCPYAVLLANMFAYASKIYGNGNVKSVIIEAYENPDIADKYTISTVPTIVINGRVAFVGLPYEEQLLNAIKKLALQ
ncbi:MAG: thioredoxin family protein [Ignisphaera sp.]|nr:thioredoxin family protein [Ignisphaera sp.]MCX8168126.1 thioredoxin family protein [Ignisphaera sp.]MDW8085439.1 thioredoxin family protein [Ignisphaera sp.]